MSHPADPGGVFASDTHRRVLGHVDSHENPAKTRDTVDALVVHLGVDEHTVALDHSEVEEILSDLEADGHVKKGRDGTWSRTAAGLKALQQ